MKITKDQLKQIISEELENLTEGFNSETGMPEDRESLSKLIKQEIMTVVKGLMEPIKRNSREIERLKQTANLK